MRILSKKYKILIEGNNFKISIDGIPQKYGFFTTRYVEAIDEEEAKRKVIDLVKSEIGSYILNNPEDPPYIEFEENLEIESFMDSNVPGSGFTWFEMDGDKSTGWQSWCKRWWNRLTKR